MVPKIKQIGNFPRATAARIRQAAAGLGRKVKRDHSQAPTIAAKLHLLLLAQFN